MSKQTNKPAAAGPYYRCMECSDEYQAEHMARISPFGCLCSDCDKQAQDEVDRRVSLRQQEADWACDERGIEG